MLSVRKERSSSKACATRIEIRAEGLAQDAQDAILIVTNRNTFITEDNMDWSLIWTAVGGIAQALAAIATFLAVYVALRLGKREDQRSLQTRYDDARPILQITSFAKEIPVHQGSQSELDWSKQPKIDVCNVGNGPAFNIKSVIYGPEATAVPNVASGSWSYRSAEKENHWYH